MAREDYAAAVKTGVVLRKLRWMGVKDGREVAEYEINTALIESLNSVERRAAIETGQEVDRQDINLRGKVNDESEVLYASSIDSSRRVFIAVSATRCTCR